MKNLIILIVVIGGLGFGGLYVKHRMDKKDGDQAGETQKVDDKDKAVAERKALADKEAVAIAEAKTEAAADKTEAAADKTEAAADKTEAAADKASRDDCVKLAVHIAELTEAEALAAMTPEEKQAKLDSIVKDAPEEHIAQCMQGEKAVVACMLAAPDMEKLQGCVPQ